MQVRKIYRGLKPGSNMPEMFFEANSRGLRGGVEYGFLSTTDQKDLARYATGMSTARPARHNDRGDDDDERSRRQHLVASQYPTQVGLSRRCAATMRSGAARADAHRGDTMLWLECSLVIPTG